MQVHVTAGNIIEENHYYAYGLRIAALSSRKLGNSYEGQLKNNYLYQGAYAELDEDMGWNDFALRNYDAQIGRFVQQDPYQQFPSPYTGMGNDPVNLIDPSGGKTLPFFNATVSGLSTTAATAITLGEVVVSSVSKVLPVASKGLSILNKASIVISTVVTAINVINTSTSGNQAGNTANGINTRNNGDPTIKISDYSFKKLDEGWYGRRRGQEIINEQETLKEFRNTTPKTNTCAIRFSHAVNNAGYPIPNKVPGVRVWKAEPGDMGNFIIGSQEVRTYLTKIEKPTIIREHIKTTEDVDKLIAEIHEKTSYGRAIIVIKAGKPDIYGATGHVDLLYRDFMQDISMVGNYGDDLGPYLKRSGHLDADLSVYVWSISK